MASSESPHIISSEATVTTAGTAVALSGSRRVKSVTIRAKAANTGQVYVGGSDVDSTVNDGLDASESVTFAHQPCRREQVYPSFTNYVRSNRR